MPSTLEALNLVKAKRDPRKYLVFFVLLNNDPSDLEKFIDMLFEGQNEPISTDSGKNEGAANEKFRKSRV